MRIAFTANKEEYIAFLKYVYFHNKMRRRLLLAGLLLLLLSMQGQRAEHFNVIAWLLQLLKGASLMVGTYMLLYGLARFLLKRMFDKRGTDSMPVTAIAEDDALVVETPGRRRVRSWGQLKGISLLNGNILLHFYFRRYSLLPATAFESEEQKQQFVNLAGAKIYMARGRENNARRLYGYGFLGLIPLVGFFAGVVLLLRGLLEFKSRNLSLIGLAAMLPSVIIYGSLFYEMHHPSGVFRASMTQMAEMELTSILKDVEFYKMQNGHYPDSLQQLPEDNFSPHYDPLSTKHGKITSMFNYQKIGDKYTLFSSGVDQLAHTADDVYPNTAKMDTGKLGLIKVK